VPTETALVLRCAGEQLVAIVHETAARAARGLLILVGGPQYRVGSHRQFVLLGRALAANGVPVMRFDHRGIGDSDGTTRSFIEITADLSVALDAFVARTPGLEQVVIWGLCDAASAALHVAARDARVAGVVLLNPWVRTPGLQSRALLRGYYGRRLIDPAFWRNLFAGRIRIARAVNELAGHARSSVADAAATGDFVADMLADWRRARARFLLVLSEQDLVAEEFRELCRRSRAWRRVVNGPRVTRRDFGGANHTFSRAAWRDQVARWTLEWLRSW
jgi:uncharacterized protein